MERYTGVGWSENNQVGVGIQRTMIGFSQLLEVERKTGRWREKQNYISKTVLR